MTDQQQIAWEAHQAAHERLRELGAEIERGEATPLTFLDHEAAQRHYRETLSRYFQVV